MDKRNMELALLLGEASKALEAEKSELSYKLRLLRQAIIEGEEDSDYAEFILSLVFGC